MQCYIIWWRSTRKVRHARMTTPMFDGFATLSLRFALPPLLHGHSSWNLCADAPIFCEGALIFVKLRPLFVKFYPFFVQIHRRDFRDLVGVNPYMYILIMILVVIDGIVPVSVRMCVYCTRETEREGEGEGGRERERDTERQRHTERGRETWSVRWESWCCCWWWWWWRRWWSSRCFCCCISMLWMFHLFLRVLWCTPSCSAKYKHAY